MFAKAAGSFVSPQRDAAGNKMIFLLLVVEQPDRAVVVDDEQYI